jgi:hypothetical protein
MNRERQDLIFEQSERTAVLMALHYGIMPHEGYFGSFTRAQAQGAIPNGARVRKAFEDPSGDRTPIGSLGTVLGSFVGYVSDDAAMLAYFVEWDRKPRIAVSLSFWKIQRADTGRPSGT